MRQSTETRNVQIIIDVLIQLEFEWILHVYKAFNFRIDLLLSSSQFSIEFSFATKKKPFLKMKFMQKANSKLFFPQKKIWFDDKIKTKLRTLRFVEKLLN